MVLVCFFLLGDFQYSPNININQRCVFPMDKFRQFGSIIIVTTDAILACCMSSPQPTGENRVAWSIALKKIIGSVRKLEPQVFVFNRPCYYFQYIFN